MAIIGCFHFLPICHFRFYWSLGISSSIFWNVAKLSFLWILKTLLELVFLVSCVASSPESMSLLLPHFNPRHFDSQHSETSVCFALSKVFYCDLTCLESFHLHGNKFILNLSSSFHVYCHFSVGVFNWKNIRNWQEDCSWHQKKCTTPSFETQKGNLNKDFEPQWNSQQNGDN